MREELLKNPVFAMAARQFDDVATFLDLSEDIRERCKWPKRLISVTVPILRDDGRTEVLFGHRVQHHLTRGPVKGGLRYHPAVDLGEVASLVVQLRTHVRGFHVNLTGVAQPADAGFVDAQLPGILAQPSLPAGTSVSLLDKPQRVQPALQRG